MNKSVSDVVFDLDLAFNSGDLKTVLSFYEENASVVLEPGKVITGIDALRYAFKSVLSLKGKAEQLKVNVIETGDLALFTSEWIFNWQSETGDACHRQSIATTVFRKDPAGEWKIAIDNSFGPAVLGNEVKAN